MKWFARGMGPSYVVSWFHTFVAITIAAKKKKEKKKEVRHGGTDEFPQKIQ
jgi:hypothetical protein